MHNSLFDQKQELEERVKERTQELNERNLELIKASDRLLNTLTKTYFTNLRNLTDPWLLRRIK